MFELFKILRRQGLVQAGEVGIDDGHGWACVQMNSEEVLRPALGLAGSAGHSLIARLQDAGAKPSDVAAGSECSPFR